MRWERDEFRLEVERRGMSGKGGPSELPPSTVASDEAKLLAGDTGAARCAGFLATGGAGFCFDGCSWDTVGFGPTGGPGVGLLIGFRFC